MPNRPTPGRVWCARSPLFDTSGRCTATTGGTTFGRTTERTGTISERITTGQAIATGLSTTTAVITGIITVVITVAVLVTAVTLTVIARTRVFGSGIGGPAGIGTMAASRFDSGGDFHRKRSRRCQRRLVIAHRNLVLHRQRLGDTRVQGPPTCPAAGSPRGSRATQLVGRRQERGRQGREFRQLGFPRGLPKSGGGARRKLPPSFLLTRVAQFGK